MECATIYLVIPCYNEQEVLPETSRRLKIKLEELIGSGMISPESRAVFVDDGSKDTTWSIIEKLNAENSLFRGIKLSRNRGHQNALLGGLMTVMNDADAVISMDADLQDDIDAIDRFIQKFYDGCDIVYGVRSARATDTAFKRITAQGFYKVMDRMGAKVVYNHADYRLMSKRALQALSQFKEVNLFLRGMVTLVGYKTDIVEYERAERFAGESKYPLKKMLSFAWDGITSFSVEPIKMISVAGIITIIASIIGFIWCIVRSACGSAVQAVAPWALSLWFFAGLILLAVGVVGEYIGKIYSEVKERPRFIIEKYI